MTWKFIEIHLFRSHRKIRGHVIKVVMELGLVVLVFYGMHQWLLLLLLLLLAFLLQLL